MSGNQSYGGEEKLSGKDETWSESLVKGKGWIGREDLRV